MARRRKSSIGMRKPRKIGTEELQRQKYFGMANCGRIDAQRFGFSSKKNGKLDVCVFYSIFAAKKFLDLIIQEDEITWIDNHTILTDRDITIRGNQLQRIYNHKLTYNEKRYHILGEGYDKRALVIRSNDYRKPFIEGESNTFRRRTSRKGMILMKVIAEELGMTPREARGILRSKMKKPEHGWAWRTTEEVTKIKNLLLGETKSVTVNFSGGKTS